MKEKTSRLKPQHLLWRHEADQLFERWLPSWKGCYGCNGHVGSCLMVTLSKRNSFSFFFLQTLKKQTERSGAVHVTRTHPLEWLRQSGRAGSKIFAGFIFPNSVKPWRQNCRELLLKRLPSPAAKLWLSAPKTTRLSVRIYTGYFYSFLNCFPRAQPLAWS